MSSFFSMDSPINRFLSRVADLLILNICFIITCIPVFTIGAALASLYTITLKMVRNQESYIFRGYLKAFKENFRQSTLMWLGYLVFIILFILDFQILGAITSRTASFMKIALYAMTIILYMLLSYTFPLQAKFYNTIKHTITNAFLMAIRHFPYTIVIMAIPVAAVVITLFNEYTLIYGILIWFLGGFSLIALAQSFFLMKVFDRYIPKEEDENTSLAGADTQNI